MMHFAAPNGWLMGWFNMLFDLWFTTLHLSWLPSGNLTWLLKMAIYCGFTH